VRWSSRVFGKVEVLRLNHQPKVNTMTDDTMPLLELLQKRGGGRRALL
jgi:hypothetical protein